MLREGNVASAHEWKAVLEPVVDHYRSIDAPVYFRADAAFAIPEVYEYLEDNEVVYAIRIKANAVLERRIEHLLRRRVGRPSKKPEVSDESFSYQAKSWDRSRRVVAKVEWHAGELFPRVDFIVTSLNRHAPNVVRFYKGTVFNAIAALRYDMGELEAENFRHGWADEPFNWEIPAKGYEGTDL